MARRLAAMIWAKLDPHVDLGFLPDLVSEDDPRPAKAQLADKYRYGGGWRPTPGFTVRDGYVLKFPDDPPMAPRAMTTLRDEVIVLYDYAFLGVFQPDGSFEVSRCD
jgi:hypothetical protein